MRTIILAALLVPMRAQALTQFVGSQISTGTLLPWHLSVSTPAPWIMRNVQASTQVATPRLLGLGADIWISSPTTQTASGTYSNAPLIFIGTNGYITSQSSGNFSSVSGDGSLLTGVIASSYSVVTNASLLGSGTAGAPLGVNSSSAAIKTASGFVKNAEIDASSIAKLSGSGLIPNSFIDGSTVPKLSGAGLIPNAYIDNSSITKLTAAGFVPNSQISNSSIAKLSGAGFIPDSQINGSSVTKLSAAGFVPNGLVSGIYSGVTGLGAQAQALNLNTNLINNVTDPSSAQDAATKNYVDTNINGFDFKNPARLATVAALPANSYNNGAGTLTGLALGSLSVDGAEANTGDRLLINNEATASHNGIYSVTTNGAGLLYVLTRTSDFNTVAEMADGVAIFVDSGATNSSTGWVTIASVTTIGTDNISFVQFTGLGDVTVGSGLSKSGNTLSVNSSSVAVKTASNFINSSEIDGSSVTKLSAAGRVPNSLVDGSSITKLSAAGLVPNVLIDPSSITKLGNGLLPNANIDGSSVTKLSAAGLIPNSLVDPSSVTKAGQPNSSGKWGDAQVNLSTNATASGTFGDNRVSVTTGAVSSGKFGDTRVAFSTNALLSGGIWQPLVLPSTIAYHATAVTFSTVTITTSDANGYSLYTSSGINASSGTGSFGMVEAGTVSARGAYLTNGVSGKTVSCAASNVPGGATWTNGILTTAGTCQSAGAGDVVSTSTQTLSGIDTFTSTVINSSGTVFRGTISSFTAPAEAGIIYKQMVPFAQLAWTQNASSTTVYYAMNVTSATFNGTGSTHIVFARPASTYRVAMKCSCGVWAATNSGQCLLDYAPPTGRPTDPTFANIQTYTAGGTASNPVNVPCFAEFFDIGTTPQ